jgi:hypothetical protein
MRRLHSGLLLAAAICIAGSGRLSWAQSTTQSSPAPCTVIPQPDPCGSKPAAGDKKPPTEKFPFPGSTPTSSQPDSSKPTLTGIPQASDPPPAPLNPGVRPDKKFPFPGETGAPAKPDAGAGASSSSSSSSAEGDPNPADAASAPDAGGSPDLKDKGSEGQQTQPGRHLLHRVNPPGTKLQSPEEREAEDLQVAHFYMDRGDLPAAYLRSQDAVKLQPDDPSAHFTLAEVALKLNKRDEAMQHYQECLKLDPSDKEAKAAQKALSRFQAQR